MFSRREERRKKAPSFRAMATFRSPPSFCSGPLLFSRNVCSIIQPFKMGRRERTLFFSADTHKKRGKLRHTEKQTRSFLFWDSFFLPSFIWLFCPLLLYICSRKFSCCGIRRKVQCFSSKFYSDIVESSSANVFQVSHSI